MASSERLSWCFGSRASLRVAGSGYPRIKCCRRTAGQGKRASSRTRNAQRRAGKHTGSVEDGGGRARREGKPADLSNTANNSGAGVVDDVVSQRRAGQRVDADGGGGTGVERQGTQEVVHQPSPAGLTGVAGNRQPARLCAGVEPPFGAPATPNIQPVARPTVSGPGIPELSGARDIWHGRLCLYSTRSSHSSH